MCVCVWGGGGGSRSVCMKECLSLECLSDNCVMGECIRSVCGGVGVGMYQECFSDN